MIIEWFTAFLAFKRLLFRIILGWEKDLPYLLNLWSFSPLWIFLLSKSTWWCIECWRIFSHSRTDYITTVEIIFHSWYCYLERSPITGWLIVVVMFTIHCSKFLDGNLTVVFTLTSNSPEFVDVLLSLILVGELSQHWSASQWRPYDRYFLVDFYNYYWSCSRKSSNDNDTCTWKSCIAIISFDLLSGRRTRHWII